MLIRKDRNIGISGCNPTAATESLQVTLLKRGYHLAAPHYEIATAPGKKEGEEQRYSEDDQTERLNSTLRN